MGMIFPYSPNFTDPVQNAPAGTGWFLLVFPDSTGGGRSGQATLLECIKSDSSGAGDGFQILVNQTGTPGAGKTGFFVYSGMIFGLDAVPHNIWVKLVTGTDLINVAVAY